MSQDRRRLPAGLVLLAPALLLGLLVGTQARATTRLPLTATRYNIPLVEAATELQNEQAALKTEIVALRAQLDEIQHQGAALGGEASVRQGEIERLKDLAGLLPRTGAGVRVTLDDARLPASAPSRTIEAGIVHSQDITDVFNAAWRAGAEAIAVNGERITSASACVGAVIQINGSLLSPPFVIEVLGPRDEVYAVLTEAQELRDLKRRHDAFGLGLEIERADELRVPAYSGPLKVRFATPRP